MKKWRKKKTKRFNQCWQLWWQQRRHQTNNNTGDDGGGGNGKRFPLIMSTVGRRYCTKRAIFRNVFYSFFIFFREAAACGVAAKREHQTMANWRSVSRVLGEKEAQTNILYIARYINCSAVIIKIQWNLCLFQLRSPTLVTRGELTACLAGWLSAYVS